MGKAEGNGDQWHGHVTALTVAPEYRRLGLAAKLMSNLEEISEKYVFSFFFFLKKCIIKVSAVLLCVIP